MDGINKVISRWNDCSRAYADETENTTLQSAITLYNLARGEKAKRVIDAGCGPGLSSHTLASSLLKHGATLYCVDIAEKMLDVFEDRFQSSDFVKNTNNYYKKVEAKDVRTRERLESVEESAKIGCNGKRVLSLAGDTEQLPFPDQTFDSYIANLVLQYTPNYLNMLGEAYRVLSEGGKATFSVYGREENGTFITFLPDILEKHGVEVDEEKVYNFDTLDTEQIIEDAKDVGFTSVKSLYHTTHYAIANGKEMWEFLNGSSAIKELGNLDALTLAKVKADVIKEFDERYGEDKVDMISFEVTVIVCKK